MAIFEWTESRYYRERLQPGLRHVSPEQFEQHQDQHQDKALATAAADQRGVRTTGNLSARAGGDVAGLLVVLSASLAPHSVWAAPR